MHKSYISNESINLLLISISTALNDIFISAYVNVDEVIK